jgi:hypothetical protein
MPRLSMSTDMSASDIFTYRYGYMNVCIYIQTYMTPSLMNMIQDET